MASTVKLRQLILGIAIFLASGVFVSAQAQFPNGYSYLSRDTFARPPGG